MQKRDKKYKGQRSCEKYKSYDPNVWSLEFFDKKTGGYVVVNRKRLANAAKYKKEGEKYEKEFMTVKVLALNGHAIEMMKEISGVTSPDVTINGVPAEIKCVKSAANMVRHARKATKKQGARIVLFKFEKMTPYVLKELKNLTERGIHGMYIVNGETEIREF